MVGASLVVPSHGGGERLPVLLESLRHQTHADFEVIVVIDGDIDGSASVVAAAGDLPVRSVVFPENRGRPAALNAGFGAARGEVLIRVDDDLELEPSFVERHLLLHQEAPRGVVGMCIDVFPDTPYAEAYGRAADERIRKAAFATPPDQAWRWWSGNVSTTREDYQRVGPYDESFRSYGWEDVDWGYRLHRAGREILIAPGFQTLHHGPVVATSERALRAFHSGSAYRRFCAKHPEAAEAPAAPAGIWDRLVRAGARLSTETSLARVGRALDATTDRMPPWLAEKLIALTIQSAADAGRRYPGRVTSTL